MQHLQHYVLILNPDAKYEWDRRNLRQPLNSDVPSLAALIQNAIGETAGQFLVSVELTVNVLEREPLPETLSCPTPSSPEVSTEPATNHDATQPLPAVQTT